VTLKLQYRCTEGERKEAKKLQEYDFYGRGSRWRGRLVLGALLAIAAFGYALRFQREVAPEHKPWFVGLCAVIFLAIVIFKRITRQKIEDDAQLEISEREVTMGAGEGKTVIQWSGFSQCLESPNLFVLVNRSKTVLFTVPKRVFSDEAAMDWFRAQANQPKGAAGSIPVEELLPGRFVSSNGIALTLRLKLRDYLNRNFTSWRMRGICLGLLVLSAGITFLMPSPPDPVNSPLKTFLIMAPTMLGMTVAVTAFISISYWLAERKHLIAQQLVVNDAGIEFVAQDSTGRLPWSTYKYYLENRWSFFMWQPQGSLWLMLPKRDFASASDLTQFRALLETKLKRSRWFYL